MEGKRRIKTFRYLPHRRKERQNKEKRMNQKSEKEDE
jgi:hypothetical protein